MKPDYIKVKLENEEDHKKFEVSWLYMAVSVDRQKGEVTFEMVPIERLKHYFKLNEIKR